ncbi:MAG TPA: hypothetical protein VLM36_02880 [Sphingomicrobium sp.]|nr:hypothetical protein [Sphingomicrobium sp.]
MLISAIVAVALGLPPVKDSSATQIVRFDQTRIAADVGRYTQTVGKDGKTRVRGVDRRGRPYDLTLDSNGHVEGEAGMLHVTFNVAEAA